MKAAPLLFASLAACSPFDPDLGAAPYLCSAGNPECPEGYTCQATGEAAPRDMACLPAGGTLPDAGNTGFQCLDDTFGNNDMKEGAFVTPVAQSPMFAALTSLCPAGDQDHYQFNLTTVTSVRVSATWESGMNVNVAILGASGNPIGNGAPRGDKESCTCLKDLPMGVYFARVSAAANVQNNYRVEIKLIQAAECPAQPACN